MVSSAMPLSHLPPIITLHACSKVVWRPFAEKVETRWKFTLGESKEQPIDTKHENSLNIVKEFLDTHRIQFPDLEEEPYEKTLGKEASWLRNSFRFANPPRPIGEPKLGENKL